jgi:hypothetical protein
MSDQQTDENMTESAPGNVSYSTIDLTCKVTSGVQGPKQDSYGILRIKKRSAAQSDPPLLAAYGYWSGTLNISGSYGDRMTHTLNFQPTYKVGFYEDVTKAT